MASSRSWSRLKPVNTDPLDAVGLPSKGDTRLLHPKTQETYYQKLVDRYMTFCAHAGDNGNGLDQAFAALSLQSPRGLEASTHAVFTDHANTRPVIARRAPDDAKSGPSTAQVNLAVSEYSWQPPPKLSSQQASQHGLSGQNRRPAPSATQTQLSSATASSRPTHLPAPDGSGNSKELSTILMAMRKLREGMLASGRTDSFAQQAYIFIARAAILTSTFESYNPALLRLLYGLHAITPLSVPEVHEFVGYHILDLCCRRGDYGEAYAVRHRWHFRDDRIDAILLSLVRDRWIDFWRLESQVDGYQRAMMRWAAPRVRHHALKCLGASYLCVNRAWVEKAGGMSWPDLKTHEKVGWELEGDQVTIRRVKRK